MLVHNYVLVEAAALLQGRLGTSSAFQFLRDSGRFQVHWIGQEDHRQAVALLEERNRRGLSLADCASFVVMRQYQTVLALAFDHDFETEGFTMYTCPDG